MESQLQDLFDAWPRRAALGWTVAGAPRWLRGMAAPRSRPRFKSSLGYTFIPDIVFEPADATYLVELKLASKYEPIALAEVLHHAWMFEHDPDVRAALGRDVPVVPVIVSQQSFWLRAALAKLFENGLAPRAVRFLEFDTFGHEGKKILWLGDPFAAWVEAVEVPNQLLEKFKAQAWFYVPDEDTWLGMDQSHDRRPAMPNERHVVASRVEGAGFVAWEGSYADSEWHYWIGDP